MIYFQSGSEKSALSEEDLKEGLFKALEQIGPRKKVLAIPPDFSRLHSQAGRLTAMLYSYYGSALKDVMPALATHAPMTTDQMITMFGDVPVSLFREHNSRHGVVTLGSVPGSFVSDITGGAIIKEWPVQLNKLVCQGGHDLIVSISQVVPHEVMGISGYHKQLLLGTGGYESISLCHFAGALYGAERLMGRIHNPVHDLLSYAARHFLKNLPVLHVQTVVARDEAGNLVVRGLYIGDDEQVFVQAAELSLRVNFTLFDKPLKKIVVYLDPYVCRSMWKGNKSITRTRLALADKGELIILAPGIKEFGEETETDHLIREYGYKGSRFILENVRNKAELMDNLSAAAHLIHGSSEGRFTITYCPGQLSRAEIEAVNYNYGDPLDMLVRYNPGSLKEGYNILSDDEVIFYIANPGVGLWASRERL